MNKIKIKKINDNGMHYYCIDKITQKAKKLLIRKKYRSIKKQRGTVVNVTFFKISQLTYRQNVRLALKSTTGSIVIR